MQEEWKEIEGYSRYKVSTFGRVWDTRNDCEVSQVLNGIPQYYYVNMTNNGNERKMERVNRLVAIAFVKGRSDEFNVSDHIDRDKLNNHYTNLRWTNHSGNQRNTENNIMAGDIHLKDFTQVYDNPDRAYSHIFRNYNNGDTVESAIEKYDEYLGQGRLRRKVEFGGNTVYLSSLCEQYGVEYSKISWRLYQGWELWNALYNINTNDFRFSFEVSSNSCTGYWFPSQGYFIELHGEAALKYISGGDSYEDALSKDGLDYLRQTVLGVTGTIKELCKHFGISEGCVGTRLTKKGWSLEKSLTTPQERIRRWSIDGETKSIKDWCVYYGLDPKRVNGWKSSKPERTFKDALMHYGVDCEDKEFQPGD